MKQVIYATLLTFATILGSCSKTTDEINTESKLIGKWTLKSWASTDSNGSQSRNSSGNYKAGEYMQFESGGLVIIRVDNEITPTTYKLLENGKVVYITPAGVVDLPDDGYEIKTLNDHSLVLYIKEVSGNNISEITIYLER